MYSMPVFAFTTTKNHHKITLDVDINQRRTNTVMYEKPAPTNERVQMLLSLLGFLRKHFLKIVYE